MVIFPIYGVKLRKWFNPKEGEKKSEMVTGTNYEKQKAQPPSPESPLIIRYYTASQ